MPRRIRFTFVFEGASAAADLLEDVAPETCAAVWSSLPVAGAAHHAVYSGSEAVLLLPRALRVPPENATSDVATGDVGFAWFGAGESYGFDREFAEICWFYDEDACPSMPEGPVPVNVFARIRDDSEAFYAVCRRMRREGVKPLAIERVEDGEEEGGIPRGLSHVAFHHPLPPASLASAAIRVPDALLVGCADEEGTVCCLLRSRDQGRTWQIGPAIARDAGPHVTTPSLVALPSGRLLAQFGAGAPSSVRQCCSDDAGETWSGPEDTGLSGGHPHLLRLADGRLHVVYETPGEPSGIGGAVSSDGGRTWQRFTIREGVGLRHPRTVRCDDRRVLCLYECHAPGAGAPVAWMASYRVPDEV